jgi:tetratricopeptide (TPR) repeat protein
MQEHFISADEAENDMLACAAYLAESIATGDGHADAMRSVVPQYLGRENVDLAAELANTIDDPFTRDRLLISVADKCAELGDDDYALQLADAIEDLGMQAQARERIAAQMVARGDAAAAAGVANMIPHPDYVFAEVAIRAGGDGNDAEARAALDKISFPTARVHALHAIAASKLKFGNREEFARLLNEAAEVARQIEHREEQVRALVETGMTLSDDGAADDAVKVFQAAKESAEGLGIVHKDAFLSACALGFLHAGDLESADATLDHVADKTQIASCLLGYSREFWKRKEHAEAGEALEEAYAIIRSQKESEIRDTRARNGVIGQVAFQFAVVGKAERAIEIAQEIADQVERASALTMICQIFSQQNEDDRARQALSAIDGESGRITALLGMADAKALSGERDASAEFVREAFTLAETLQQLSLKASALNEIAKRCIDLGLQQMSSEVLHESLQNASQIRDKSTQASAVADLSALFWRSGTELSERDKDTLRSMVGRASV